MKTTYEQQWREYRKRCIIFLIIFATCIPAVVLVENLLHSDTVFFIVSFVGMLAFFVAGIRILTWPCPRCGKSFYVYGSIWRSNPFFTGRCLHCGLPKWSVKDTRKTKELPFDQLYCLQCGNMISNGDSTCAKCGWSWEDSVDQQADRGERE
jgi:hypothetical protein